ncbi:PREDICTED: FK506-binding protein 15-like [Priapulus caudatus]|uniref:peptidylprolyl isomerase n=1 Tax=Priapulus caudatus TaxID=37621 RepID=A0ABM1EIX3_PRICU|nr:PREDICTED: FK506-binding protein 15-like [Priapulus caudatus]
MFSRTGDDDAEDFGVTAGGGRSNLASLFGMDQAASKSGNNALVYTAPKQPRKQQGHQGNEQSRDNQDDPGGKALAVLYAVATNVFKYIDGQFAKQGRLGAAILGATGEFHKLLLYMGKQQTVTQAVIGRTFAFTVQANNYANFYDDQRQSWSLMFDSTQNAIAFAKQVAFAKANSGKEQGLVMQDLIPGEGGGLEVDDSAEVRYTGWLMVNHVQGPQFDSNVSADKNFRLKMGRGKVIKGWEEGMIGMKKGGRRLLIIPPSLGYGTHGMGTRVPPNSTLILDVELIKVKLTREHGSRAESPTKVGGLQAEQVDTTDTTVTKSRADSVKDRSASLSEQMSHPSASTDKAQLIQRMAKMGQPMLPMQGAVAAATESDDEDSDSDVVVADASPIHNSPAHRPTISPKPHNLPISKASAADPVKHSATPPPVMQPTMSRPVPQYSRPSAPTAEAVGTIMYGHQAPASLPPHQSMSVYQPAAMPMATLQGFPYYAQPPPASSPAASSDTSLQTFMMESRQQSTEVRLSLSKLQDRVDQITAKIEKLPTSSPQGGQVALPAFGSAMPSMDTAILMNSVQKIVQENEKHKAEIVEKNAKLEKQNEKIAELLDKNQRFMENSNTWMEQRHDIFKSSSEQSQVQLITLQQEKIMMGGELAVAESKVTALQSQLSAEQEKAVALTGQLAAYCADAVKQREEATHLKAMMSEKEQKLASLSQLLCEEEVRKKEAEHKVKQLDSELDILREKTRSLEETHNEMEGKFSLVTQNAETDIWALKAEHEPVASSSEEARKLSEALTEERRVSEESMNKRLVNTTATVVEEWKVKLASCMETANQQHSDEIEKAEETKTQLMSELEEVRLQMDAERQRQVAHSTELQEEIEVMQVWKDKYIALREQAVAMKLAYTGKIEELTAKLEEQESSNQAPSTDVALEVKRVMSAVYHAARSEFEEQESYSGAEVQSALLRTIKEVTLQLLSPAVRERSESEAMSEGEQDSQPQIRQESPLTEHRQQSVAENVTRESAAEEAPESESTARDAEASDESFEFVQKTNDSSDRQPEPAELPVVSVHEDDLEPQGQASSMLGPNENPEDAEQMGGAPAKEPVVQLGEYEQQTQLEPQQMGVECERQEQVEPSEMLAEQEQSVQAEGGAEEHTKAKIPVESGESNEGVCHEDHQRGQPESAAVDMCASVGELEQEDEEEQWQQEQPEEDSLSARIREQEQQQEQPENEVLPQQIVPDREAAERVGYAEGGEHIIDETSETESLEAEPLDDLHQQLTVDFREPPNTSFPEGNEYLSNESKNSSAVGQEEVPALVRENEPALVQEEIQALVQEEVSSLVQEEVPSLEQEEIPALVNEKVPALVQEEVPSLEQVEVPSLEQEREPALVQEEMPSLVKEEEPSSVQEEIPALVQEEELAVVQEEDQPLEQGASTLMQEEQEVASLQQEEEVALMEEKVSEDPKSVSGQSRSSEKASTSLFNDDDDDDEEGCRVGKPPAQLVSCPPSRSKVKLSAKKTPPEGTKTSTSLFEEDDAEDEQFGVSLFSQPSVPAQPSSLPGQQASHTPKDSASRRLVDEAMDSDTSSNDSSGANAGRPVPPPLFGDDDDDDNDIDWFK